MEEKKISVLVIDDQPVNLELMKNTLTMWDFNVELAYRGVQRIDMAREKKPDIILLDVLLPDLTGYEVCRALKVNPVTASIPVIFVTARGEIFDRVEGFEMGAQDYIPKPFHPQELKARIMNAFRMKEEKEKLIREADELRSKSILDDVTGFYNRRYLEERLGEEVSRAKRYNYPISLALIYPDGLNEIRRVIRNFNADDLIRELGHIVKNNIRAIDVTTRFDGNSFAVILVQTEQEGSSAFGEKLNNLVAKTSFNGMVGRSRFTVSVGIATSEKAIDLTVPNFIREAEKALKKAQSMKGNQTVVYEV